MWKLLSHRRVACVIASGGAGVGYLAAVVMLTVGATQGFALLIRYLLAPGDAVLVDDPGYYNLFGHLKLAGAPPPK